MGKKQIILLCVLIAVVFAAGSAATTYFILKNQAKDEIYVGGDSYGRLIKFYELDDVTQLIDEYYYKEVDSSTLVTGSLKGVLESLGDGYSKFYPEKYFKYFDENTEGSYMALGMLVDKDDETGYVIVKKVFADTPAYENNISAGNYITSIDGMDTLEMDAESAVSCLRGTEGTEVSLTLIAGSQTLDVVFTRKNPQSQVVFSDMLDNGIGYIDIMEFSGSSVSDFKNAIKTITDENATSLIIDIRDNPGGYISQASEIADMLLSSGDIYYTLNRTNDKFVISADEEKYCELPIVILTNENTKGPAEVFAAALKENGVATSVGTATYGKGVVMATLQVPNTGDGIRLVSAYYYSPKGNSISDKVLPDVEVENSSFGESESDAQLEKAKELLTQ